MRTIIGCILCVFILTTGPVNDASALEMDNSVVKIVNHFQRPQWDSPWSSYSSQKTTGSGFVIDGGLIMSNAHVVSDSKMLLIYLNGDPTPYEARVKYIGHDCDLAVLEPEKRGLLSNVPAVTFGDLPALRSTVETYGYPSGGQRISSTKGVVSRIEIKRYMHSSIDYHLTVQTDAAINPGNSGGPVVQNGKVVGVAFQGSLSLENAGWFIPMEVVNHFVKDIEDGVYDGYPDVAVLTKNMENPALRKKSGMTASETGIVVEYVYPKGSADGYLAPGDAILKIEDYDVANDSTVAMNGLRLDASILIDRKQKGETAHLYVLRNGRRFEVEIPLTSYAPFRKMGDIYDKLPRYFIYAGLVFVPLNVEVLKLFGKNWSQEAPKSLLYEFRYKPLEDPEHVKEEPIVLLRRLDHPVNINMAFHKNLIVEKVNGRVIHRLEDIIEAIESNKGKYQMMEFRNNIVHVLDRKKIAESNDEILLRYGIPEDRRL